MADASRDFADLGIHFRPRIFEDKKPEATAQLVDAAESASEQSSPGQSYTNVQTLYLKTTGTNKGVLQIHRAAYLNQHGNMGA